MIKQHFDVILIGSGIAGSVTSLVLARHGLKVCLIERGRHPRFAIGESTVPTTTLIFTDMARRLDLPELECISHFSTLAKIAPAWPKCHFWFGHHTAGRELEPERELLFETLSLPLGPDVHMLRSEVDAYLTECCKARGVTYLEGTEMLGWSGAAGSMRVEVKTGSEHLQLNSKLIVDSSGHQATIGRKAGLVEGQPNLRTCTRAIFGHFCGVADIDEVCGGTHPNFRFKRTAGTMHHFFDGGWFWVIPFHNGVTSVGLVLDADRYPRDPGGSPESEFQSFVDRFPTLRRLFADRQTVVPLRSSGRIQFLAKTIRGDGFILAPHGAGFIDPLYSTGILKTTLFAERMGIAVQEARAQGREWFDPKNFSEMEKAFYLEVGIVDRIVSASYKASADFELYRQVWRYWVYGLNSQYSTRSVLPNCVYPLMFGANLPAYSKVLDRIHAILDNTTEPPRGRAAQIQKLMDPWAQVFAANFEVTGGMAVACGATAIFPSDKGYLQWLQDAATRLPPSLREEGNAIALQRLNLAVARTSQLAARMRMDPDYSTAIERITALAVDPTWYRSRLGLST